MSELFSPLYSVELDSVLDPASVTDQYDRFDRGQITMDDFFNKIVRGGGPSEDALSSARAQSTACSSS